MEKENVCKVCSHHYPADVRKCPKCGCPQGGNKPAYLRCKRCGTVFSSRRQTCPSCGIHVSPQTAAGILLPPGEAERHRRAIVRWSVAAVALLLLLIIEGFVVKNVYANLAYRESLHLWNCGGSIEANRRAPDPVYEEVVTPSVIDSLFQEVANAPSTDTLHTTQPADTMPAPETPSTYEYE